MKKTIECELLVHVRYDGTSKSPVVGIQTEHGILLGRDEDHLREQIRFVLGCEVKFTSRKLDNTPITEVTLRHVRGR